MTKQTKARRCEEGEGSEARTKSPVEAFGDDEGQKRFDYA